jgi:hypothetical protein
MIHGIKVLPDSDRADEEMTARRLHRLSAIATSWGNGCHLVVLLMLPDETLIPETLRI